jgi:FkbM family methyltransferase
MTRFHPLHALRKSPLFRAVTRRFDPMIKWRTPLLSRPIYLRLISNASLIGAPQSQEDSIRETFIAVVGALPKTGGGTFWDIGANIGLYSWFCANTRPDFSIVSFEPDAKNLECLRKTSAAWQLPNHKIVDKAVSDEVGRTTFYTDEISRATGTLEPAANAFNAKHYGAVPKGIEIQTVTLDHLLAEGWLRPLVMKIDVEGAELRVLRGGRNFFAEHPPILFLEMFGDRPQIFSLLDEFGYECFDSDRRTEVVSETVNVLALPPKLESHVADASRTLGYPLTAREV